MKKSITTLILILFMLIPTSSFAKEDRWVFATNYDNTSVFIDSNTVGYDGQILSFWVQRKYPQTNNKIKGKVLDREIYLIEANVSKRIYRMSNFLQYDANGNILKSDDNVTDWIAIIPSSIGELMVGKAASIIIIIESEKKKNLPSENL